MNQYIFRDILIYCPDDFVQLKLNCQLIGRMNQSLRYNWASPSLLNEGTCEYIPFPLVRIKLLKNGVEKIPLCMNTERILKLAGYYNLPEVIHYYFSYISPLNPHLRTEYDVEIGCFMSTLCGVCEGNHELLFEHLITLIPQVPNSQNEFKEDHMLDEPFQIAVENENMTILKLFIKYDLLKRVNLKWAYTYIHNKKNPDFLLFYNDYIDPEPDWDATLNFSLKHKSLSLFYRSMTELCDSPLRPQSLFFLYAFCSLPNGKNWCPNIKYLVTPTSKTSILRRLKKEYREHSILKFYVPILQKFKSQDNRGIERYIWYNCLKGACYNGNFPLVKKLYEETNELLGGSGKLTLLHRKIKENFCPHLLLEKILANSENSDEDCWYVIQGTINLVIECPLVPDLELSYDKEELIQKIIPNTCAYLRPKLLERMIEELEEPIREPNDSLTNLCYYYDPTKPQAKSKAKRIIRILKGNGATHCTAGRCKFIPNHELKGIHKNSIGE